MSETLERWQERLEKHFELLAPARASSGFPLFVLEHGLTEQEIGDISVLVRSRVKAGFRLTPHWLVGAVYATERGYAYEGDEYWQSFEEQTPNWTFADRYQIVPWFTKFQRAFNGFVPSGPWAEHFKIITWPITHAILPRYLQVQFAKALYDLRFRLASLQTVDPAALGRILAASTGYTSTRFGKFLQQEELTGRIVLALLHKDVTKGDEPIYPPALARIVKDLEQTRNAREWLMETRRVSTDRIEGIKRGILNRKSSGDATETITPANIRPDLFLRYAGSGAWSLALEVPNFRSVAELNADIHAFLKRTPCRLNGATDTKPAGWLLSGKRSGVLKSWPDSQKALIEFEAPHPLVEHILQSSCRMTTGPAWLFRIGRDGIAREITGRIVRPGYDYIVITAEEMTELELLNGMTLCTVTCAGVKPIRISMPTEDQASDYEDYATWLDSLGIQVARTIRIWPAGLAIRGWNGEGVGTWLTTEEPCFGITHDHAVDEYVLNLNDEPSTVIRTGPVGDCVFVRLERLPAGIHILKVAARKSASLYSVASESEGSLELRVRDPEPWIPGKALHTGLVVTLDPYEASLDVLWENALSLTVLGPENHQVVCTVSLQNGQGVTVFTEDIGEPIPLPVTPAAWRTRFAKFLAREDIAFRYLEASKGTLTIKGEELGEYVVRLEREVLPLRWVLHHDRSSTVIRLIDDTGIENSKPECSFFSMERPTTPQACRLEEFLKGFTVTAPGGLFLTLHGNYTDAIVVSVGLPTGGLKGLGVVPAFDTIGGRSSPLTDVFRILGSWWSARTAGFLCDIRRLKVMNGFMTVIYENMCGTRWARAEAAFVNEPSSSHTIEGLQLIVDRHAGFAVALRRGHDVMSLGTAKGVPWFADVVGRYGVCPDGKVAEFALRLASEPQNVADAFGSQFNSFLHEVGRYPALLRGARFVALLSANRNCSGRGVLAPEWKWQ